MFIKQTKLSCSPSMLPDLLLLLLIVRGTWEFFWVILPLEKRTGRMLSTNWRIRWISGHGCSPRCLRGRVLVINNLVASVLWHWLICLDPPSSGLLSQLHSKLINFFWDSLHWVPQGVLCLPREEGGQSLVHLVNRTATFRIQFLQKVFDWANRFDVEGAG